MIIILKACSRLVHCILLKTLFVLDLPSKLFKSSFTFLSYPPRTSTTMFVCWTLKPSFLSISSPAPQRPVFLCLAGVGLAPISPAWTCHFYNIKHFLPFLISFFIFVNYDLADSMSNVELYLFADDTTIYTLGENIDGIIQTLQSILDHTWCLSLKQTCSS